MIMLVVNYGGLVVCGLFVLIMVFFVGGEERERVDGGVAAAELR
ncbi:hypothetical protein HanPSC8_Chr09g0402141 [Helianthus annuus]|nr:hypothetical protein HanPSC8_Chr09g0402141 [Helianthus annuus]